MSSTGAMRRRLILQDGPPPDRPMQTCRVSARIASRRERRPPGASEGPGLSRRQRCGDQRQPGRTAGKFWGAQEDIRLSPDWQREGESACAQCG
jgi:hypothetical protein